MVSSCVNIGWREKIDATDDDAAVGIIAMIDPKKARKVGDLRIPGIVAVLRSENRYRWFC